MSESYNQTQTLVSNHRSAGGTAVFSWAFNDSTSNTLLNDDNHRLFINFNHPGVETIPIGARILDATIEIYNTSSTNDSAFMYVCVLDKRTGLNVALSDMGESARAESMTNTFGEAGLGALKRFDVKTAFQDLVSDSSYWSDTGRIRFRFRRGTNHTMQFIRNNTTYYPKLQVSYKVGGSPVRIWTGSAYEEVSPLNWTGSAYEEVTFREWTGSEYVELG